MSLKGGADQRQMALSLMQINIHQKIYLKVYMVTLRETIADFFYDSVCRIPKSTQEKYF